MVEKPNTALVGVPSERVIGGKGGFNERRDTEMFNGYEQQVASLYAGMDLKRNY